MTTPPRPPRLLLLTTLICAVAGVTLLHGPHDHESSPTTESTTRATTAPSSAPAAANRPPTTTPSATSTPSPVLASALPPHGKGTTGDQAIQHALEAAWPADLPAADERELLTAGRALLHADATGNGRASWPGAIQPSRKAVAPAFATARFRIQAAIARCDGEPNRAVVHLVWAGTDRGGTYTDGRVTDWHFTRTPATRGPATWTPQPPT
ncbi:hypothetical protein [Streptomyces sp. NPDC003635]